jgi:nickel-dependent lactate racemase
MQTYSVPYGKGNLQFTLPSNFETDIVELAKVDAAEDPLAVVEAALDSPVGGINLTDFRGARSAAIAISDNTRPVPHDQLLPPLLRRLADLDLSTGDIRFFIASGIHPRMEKHEYASILPDEILTQYQVTCHNADDPDNLVHLGDTSRGTPVTVNRGYAEADLRLVVGNIEPHQFQGFSGGVKGGAIGLAGRDTINANHSMISEPGARMGSFDENPARQDVEEIGRIIGIHFALNAILNHEKRIVHALSGEPFAVMQTGIPLSLSMVCVRIPTHFDLAIASAGGHPKDLNLYQSQKALSHASSVVKDGGTVILVAACPQGTGSDAYETWMKDKRSHERVISQFREEGFRVGPHKALQIARDALRVQVILVSDMEPEFVKGLLLTPASTLQQAIDSTLIDLPDQARAGIFPRSPSTIPILESSSEVPS